MSTPDALPLDADLAAVFADDGRPAAEVAREYIVLEAYRRRGISSGRAARLLGMDKWDFIGWAGTLGIPYIDLTEEEWAREMQAVDSLLARLPSSSMPAR